MMNFPFRVSKKSQHSHQYNYHSSNIEQVIESIEATGIPSDRRLVIGSAALTLAGAETGLFQRHAKDVDMILPLDDISDYLRAGQTPSGIRLIPNRPSNPRFLSTPYNLESSYNGEKTTPLKVDLLPWFDHENGHQSFEDYFQNSAESFMGIACVSLARAADYKRKHPHHITDDGGYRNAKARYDDECLKIYANSLSKRIQ